MISITSHTGISAHLLKYTPLSSSEIQLFSPSIRSVILANNSCNDRDYTVFDFSRFSQVESIEIGDECFGSVQTFKIDGLNRLKSLKIGINSFTQKKNSYQTFKIDGLNRLKSLKIGINSFTQKKNSYGNDKSKSFHILNCESLESIKIGEYSFSDFAGDFELKNLPQLQSIQIGAIGSQSFNFYCSSFVIRGIEYDIEYYNE